MLFSISSFYCLIFKWFLGSIYLGKNDILGIIVGFDLLALRLLLLDPLFRSCSLCFIKSEYRERYFSFLKMDDSSNPTFCLSLFRAVFGHSILRFTMGDLDLYCVNKEVCILVSWPDDLVVLWCDKIGSNIPCWIAPLNISIIGLNRESGIVDEFLSFPKFNTSPDF